LNKDAFFVPGYNPSTPVGITDGFEGAAMHYLDTLIPPGGFIRKLSAK